ncbi:MAG TPA: LacI family DNA-binding transcriptional regulator [Paenibacillus sp.]|uniref:LacI family DNA-binding transcriptional regulator n=1 Tax=Paenibacillus sp. TaxID=58172 RepID=UPI002B54C360|nr:LacI family DNA-binding transcriptional regulator [Paenibacillus sp.]HUC92179.1 LacI family DNA-binding transcriptional regulator [Paenibacillus sp.]
MPRHITIKDVARLAGVSPATVSLALSGDNRVSIKTRQLVKEAADKINYIPNEIGRSLRLQRTETIALIIPNTSQHVFSHPYYSQLLEGITEVLNGYGYNLLLSLNPSEQELSAAYDKVLRNRRADGVIVSSASTKDRNLLRLIESGFPLVYLGKWLHDDVLGVERDDIGGAYAATDHLIRLGRRRIAHFSGPLDHQAGNDRLEGYRKALRDHNIPFDPLLVLEKDFSQEAGYEAAAELVGREIPFDALFAGNDLMAVGAMKLFREKRINIPEDISLVGFDDIELASLIQPALTTIHQPMKEVGIIAAQKLIALLNGQPAEEKQSVVATNLIVRESCGAKKDG